MPEHTTKVLFPAPKLWNCFCNAWWRLVGTYHLHSSSYYAHLRAIDPLQNNEWATPYDN